MLYIKKGKQTFTCFCLDPPVYVRRQKNGVVVSIDSFALAQGVLSPDHSQIWQLSGRPSLGEDYEEVDVITAAEYDAWVAEHGEPDDEEPGIREPEIEEPEIEEPEIPDPEIEESETEDPEDTNPVIPETMDPKTVLTRAELTEKVMELDEALQMILSEEVGT